MSSSRYDRVKHRCFMCGVVIDVQKSRARHVLQQHNDRCARATLAERETFRTKGRWPKAKKVTP